ncbi:unnamed protein product [Adineta ricciae]|uniref:PLAT domain-containing protein n=1 Tax=Adineta ricciae TaxID=249248 RepID=A0A814T0R9_ADIRI|nr:unnamed protein product [Adineta ricciae]
MTKNFNDLSLLNCRLLETPLGCTVTIEYERLDWQEDIHCNIRFHGRHSLSPMLPIVITKDSRTQMNFVFQDVGEIMAVEIQLLSNKRVGLNIKWIEINIAKKDYSQKFNVHRWLHPSMGDGRTRLILTPNNTPGYVPQKKLENVEQPKRDYVKYMILVEVSKVKGNIDDSILSIDLVGKYGRTGLQRLNTKYDEIVPLKTDIHANLFELTMLDVGLLQDYEINLENTQNNTGAYLLGTIYIFRKQYYEILLQHWIESDQTLRGHIRTVDSPLVSSLFHKIQTKSSFILWLTGSNLIRKEIKLPIYLQFNCQNNISKPNDETITIRSDSVAVLAISTACATPLDSIMLGFRHQSTRHCLVQDITVLDVFQGQYFPFYYDNEPAKSSNDIDYYLFVPQYKSVLPLQQQNSKSYVISLLTSARSLSRTHAMKIVLRGERGLTNMLSLHDSAWNQVPFEAKHKDKFLLLGADIGKIIGLTLFHLTEETKYSFDILEIFHPDNKMCIRLPGKHEIFNEIIDFNCHEPPIVYTVEIKTGVSTLNDTADITLTLIGEESSLEWILLTCDSDTKPFRTGQVDTFYIPSKKLGKIRAVDISCSNVDTNCKWFCETIAVQDTVFNLKSNFIINRWCGDHQEVDLIDTSNTISKTTLIQPASTKLLTTFLLTVKSGLRTTTNSILTPSIYIFFTGQFGSSPVLHLNELTDRLDLFQSLQIDEFTFTIPDTGTPMIMRIWNTEHLAVWTCDYIDIQNLGNSKTIHFPIGVDLQKTNALFSSYIDVEADVGRVTLPLAGPRNDAAYPSYELLIRTAQTKSMDDGNVSIQLKGDKTLSKQIPLIESYSNSSIKVEGASSFLLYGLCSFGELTEIFIFLDKIHRHTKWSWQYIVIHDYLNDKYYGTKANHNQYIGKMKLNILNTIDPSRIDVEFTRIEKDMIVERASESGEQFSTHDISLGAMSSSSDPKYRIVYKTQANTLTNMSSNGQILMRLIGNESTRFFSLEHARQLTPGSMNEYIYTGNEYIHELDKLDLQLIDNDENTRWACESIEVHDLQTNDIITFPINNVIDTTKTTTWECGVKSPMVYLISVRTGEQGASLNFRYGSASVSLKLYGDSGVSNEISLHIPGEQSFYLRANQVDTFEINQLASAVGQISSIDLYHNGKKEDFWNIQWINIKDIMMNKSFDFTIEKRLNKDLGTNLKILHIPADVSTRKSMNQLSSRSNYVIRVKTGAQTPMHTNDNNAVSIVLIDPLNDSNRIPLTSSDNSTRSTFQADQEDRFDITIVPMLELKVMQIYFHGTFPWFCERIIVTDQTNGLSYRFDVEQWFTEKDNDHPMNIYGQREDDIGWTCSVTVRTQAVLPAQTNLRGKLLISIYGQNFSLIDAILGSGRLMYGLFHAGSEDTIELKSAKRLGEIHSIELRLEVAEWQSWLCDMIEIVDPTGNWDYSSRSMIPKTYKFPINRWLGAYAMDKRTVLQSIINQEPGYSQMPTYIVHILTGTKNMLTESNIQTNVYLQLFCTISNHVYGPILLDKSSNNTQPFRKGQIDEFYIHDLAHCGEIKKIRLWHDGDKSTSWHCEWIKITNIQRNEVYEFSVEKVLDEDIEEGSSNLILYCKKRDDSNENDLHTPSRILIP